jgi:hypothetical protein
MTGSVYMARQTRLHEHHRRPGRGPEERRDPYTPPREEPGTSDEIVMQGKIDYAEQSYPRWPEADSARQYIATPEGMQEIQHGVVTWADAAESDKDMGEKDIERKHEPGHRELSSKPQEYDL